MLNDSVLRLFIVFIAIFNVLDAIFTSILMHHDLMVEMNPITKYFIDYNVIVFVILKISLVSAACFYLWKRRGLLLAKIGIILCFIIYLCLILHFLISIL